MWRSFKRHKLALVASVVLILAYLVAAFAPFIAPNLPHQRWSSHVFAPPQMPRFVDDEGDFHLRPFVYGLERTLDPITWERVYEIDPTTKNPIYFFIRGETYRLFGLFETNIHLFGTGTKEPLLLFG